MVVGKPEEKGLLKSIIIRCYAELNDFLPSSQKQRPIEYNLKTPITVAEALESIGIPLSEVDLVLVNSKPVNRQHRLYENDYVSVYPTFESFDISSLKTTQKEALRITRFILDAHLGKLSKYLRMIGFDALYQNDFGDEEIIETAQVEKRIILTRDKLLLKSKKVSHGYFVRSTEKHTQLQEVVRKFDLYGQFKPFTRCMTCNAMLTPLQKEDVVDKVDSAISNVFDSYFYCKRCDKVFWEGSHFKRMEALILNLIKQDTKVF